MILYHGGAEPIINPDIVHSRKSVDFGPGFYVTPFFDQAKSWCEKRRRKWNGAYVSQYVFDEDVASQLKVLKFESYSAEWLDFIVSCRRGIDVSDWDIVSGGIANDRVFDTLEAFFDGFANREQTIDKLRFQEPNMQYCFRTDSALKTLIYVGGKEL